MKYKLTGTSAGQRLTRQQRSEMVSQQVQMLQRDRPNPTFRNPDPDTDRPPGASKTVDEDAAGVNVGPGPMGGNDTSTREGPLSNQGVDMQARTDISAGADTRAARSRGLKSTGQPVTVEDVSERAGSGLEGGLGTSTGDRLSGTSSQEQMTDIVIPEEPQSDLVISQGGGTIAAGNFRGVILDHLTKIAEPTGPMTSRRTRSLAQSLIRGKVVRFESKEELAAVRAEAKDLSRRRLKLPPTAAPENGKKAKVFRFKSIEDNVRNTLLEKMVAGKYDNDGILSGTVKYKQPILNTIERVTTMNGSFLAQDGERLLKKVRSLLPAATTTQQRARRPAA